MSMSSVGNSENNRKRGVSRGGKKIKIAEPDLSTLAGRFAAARKAVGLTPAQLSRELEVSRSAVSRIEKGHSTRLRASTLTRMEVITHHRAQWIETGEGPRLASSHADALSARHAAFTMSPDQLRDSVLQTVDAFSKEDVRVMIDALLNRLQPSK